MRRIFRGVMAHAAELAGLEPDISPAVRREFTEPGRVPVQPCSSGAHDPTFSAVIPPSTKMFVPVIQFARSDTSNATTSATSSGDTRRPSGTDLANTSAGAPVASLNALSRLVAARRDHRPR